MWTNLNLGLGWKLKKKMVQDICEKTLDINFERDRWIGLGSTFSDGHTYIHTHTHTHTDIFLKHIFRMW